MEYEVGYFFFPAYHCSLDRSYLCKPPCGCLFTLQIDSEEYGEALSLAQAYHLDSDLVYQRQWRKSPVSIASIQDYLVRDERRDGCRTGGKRRSGRDRAVSVSLPPRPPPPALSSIPVDVGVCG